MVRTTVAGLVLVAAMQATVSAGMVGNFSDILFWAGSGTNQAAFVLEFGGANGDADSPTSIAWGYRWNGAAVAADMVFALTGSITGAGVPGVVPGSDPRLGIDALDYGPGLGIGVVGFTYDQVGLPSVGWTQTLREMVTAEDYSVYPALFLHAPGDPDVEAWPVTAFTPSAVGISSEPLDTNYWYAFAPTSGDPYPPDPRLIARPVAAVPEPADYALLTCGVAGAAVMACRRRRRKA